MIYAMISIGILGFIVWSNLVALFSCEAIIIIFTISLDSLYLYNYITIRLLTTAPGSISADCSNVNNITQPAGNCNITGSSETICESRFNNFRLNYKLLYNKQFKADSQWLFWFIGFVEGDGAILSHLNKSSFVITQKEREILEEIESKLGFGQVKDFNGFSRYMVFDNKNIFLLYSLFNGNLVLSHRRLQLEKWHNNLHNASRFDLLKFNLIEIPKIKNSKKVPSLNNAWLSGFTDAEGCFNITIGNGKSNQIRFRYILDQKDPLIMQQIRDLFNVGSIIERKDTKNPGIYRLTISCSKTDIMDKISNYFKTFPLKTKKSKDMKSWGKIFNLVQKDLHKTSQGLIEIKLIKSLMNK